MTRGVHFSPKKKERKKKTTFKPFATPVSHNIELLLLIGPLHPFLKKYG
jgi:hypothetical protein